MMKRRNVVIGVILASLLMVVIVIQATFGVGVGGGVEIIPHEASVNQGSTFTYVIILHSVESDCFDLTIIPRTDSSCFEWRHKRVCVGPKSETLIDLDVTPTESGTFTFTVRAESGSTRASDTATLHSKSATPTPTPTPPPPTNQTPECIGLMPDPTSPQKIMTESEKKEITWTAFACDSGGDVEYSFCVHRGGLLGWNCTAWSTSPYWVWKVSLHSDYLTHSTAYYDIRVDVRNSTHPEDWDSWESDYEITVSKIPKSACLIPAKFSPQPAGTAIKWTACALDPEGDQDTLWYRFWVNDAIKQNWNTNNTWTWFPTNTGIYEIKVWIRDNFLPPLSTDASFPDIEATFEDYEIYM
jgi:hypothetical protein